MQKLLYRKAAGYLSDQMYVTIITTLEKKEDGITGVRKRLHLQSDAYVYPDLIILTENDCITVYEPIRPQHEEMIRKIADSDEGVIIATILDSLRRELIGQKYMIDPAGEGPGQDLLPGIPEEYMPGPGETKMEEIMIDGCPATVFLEG